MKQLLTDFSNDIKNDLNKNIDVIKTKLEDLEKNWNASIAKIDSCIRKDVYFDREIRKRNIIIHGLEEEGNSKYLELERQVVKFIKNKIKVDLKEEEIDFLRRIGKKIEDKTRPILVGITTFRKKIMILKNKRYLKDTDIYITEDFSPEVLTKRKELRGQMMEERKNGKFAILVYDKLIVRDEKESTGKRRRRASSDTPKRGKANKVEAEKSKVKKLKEKVTPASAAKDISTFFRERTNSESSTSSVYSNKNSANEGK